MFEPGDIQKLAELFQSEKKDSDSDEELPEASDGNVKKATDDGKPRAVNPYAKIENNDEAKRRKVLDDDDVEFFEDQGSSVSNWKKTPTWNVAYKQQVTASDVYLQMGMKTPATSSCEDMIVTIDLPGEKYQNMDLKIKETHLILESPRFYLKLNLPFPVDPQQGNAKFDSETDKLMITLRLNREFDFVNF